MERDFKKFAEVVQARFNRMSEHELFVVDASREALWELYLAAFPEGANPMFRTRTEHDCSCCRNFVGRIGNVVAIVDGQVWTVWDTAAHDPEIHPAYNEVALVMQKMVNDADSRIISVFRTKERRYGKAETVEMMGERAHTWHHFEARIQNRHYSAKPDEVRGIRNTEVRTFRRGLQEITSEGIDAVANLIENDSLYRGDEVKDWVYEFASLIEAHVNESSVRDKELFVWSRANAQNGRFRNSAIGQLAVALSAGEDLEVAVGKYEAMVAPENYKRPKSLITPGMVKKAMETITDLGLEPALERRHAKLSDVSVNDVLFVDNSVQGRMKGGIEGVLMQAAIQQAPNLDKAEKIGVQEFLSDVLPRVASIDLLVENTMKPKFVSLTAPVNESAQPLFKWNNGFAWSYNGDLADSSIKQRVKQAGGQVDAAMRFSLGWQNLDDLDIHCCTPQGHYINYGNKGYPAIGELDVDMNVQNPVRDAVENICFEEKAIRNGTYKIWVQNFTRRESTDVGFEIEIEAAGDLRVLRYDRPVIGNVPVANVVVRDRQIVDVIKAKDIVSESASREIWGVKTQTLVRVDTLVTSPNHWNGRSIGNKHWIFVLAGCRNPEPVRGIYNELLRSELDIHRKVFEILGDKTKCPVSDNQMSGVGFSATRRDTAKVLVRGPDFQKPYEIQF